MVRLSRIEQKERRELEKKFLAIFKNLAKSRGWEFLKPTAFRQIGDWFVTLDPSIYLDEVKAHIGFKIKPISIDSLITEIAHGRPLDRHPLSLLARGPHCLTSDYLTEPLPPTGPADLMLSHAEGFMAEVEKIAQSFSLEDFYKFESRESSRGDVSQNALMAKVIAGDFVEARKLIEQSRKVGLSGFTRTPLDQIELWIEKHTA